MGHSYQGGRRQGQLALQRGVLATKQAARTLATCPLPNHQRTSQLASAISALNSKADTYVTLI
jgi:hypothetical protein